MMKIIKRYLINRMFKLAKEKGKYEAPINLDRAGYRKFSSYILNILGTSKDIVLEDKIIDGVTVKYLKPDRDNYQVILFLHGGGHRVGWRDVGNLYVSYVSLLASKTGAQIWIPDYRVAPENPLPAGLDDCYKVYNHLLEIGISPNKITIIGDSAGGGLTLSLLIRLRDEKIALPKGAITLSALTDLALTGTSHKTREKLDPMFSPEGVERIAKQLVNLKTERLPDRSPLYGDLKGLCPLLMIVGGKELIHDDTTRFAEKARKAGVKVELIDNEKMFHVYPVFANAFPDGMEAIDKMVEFIRK